MNDGLKAAYRKAMIEIFASNPRVERAVLFGSRAMGTFTTTSDVDVALFGDLLTLDDQSALAKQIGDLPMPQRIDLLLHRQIQNLKLLAHIQRYGVEWYRRGNCRAIADK